RSPRHARARPGPLKIEAADAAIDVENLSHQIQPCTDARLHRRRVDLAERYSTGRHLGVVIAACARDRERPRDERVHEAASILSAEMRQLPRPIQTQLYDEGVSH